MRYFMELSYLGKAYNGWQIQPNAPSVQQTLQEALTTLLRRPTDVVGAGRTDTGVHAAYYVVHVDVESMVDDPAAFCYHLNSLLPHDIAVSRLHPVRDDAHARFHALKRTYEYRISTRKDPFTRDITYQLTVPLDLECMNQAAALLLQYDDFTSFSKLHSDNKTNLCRVSEAHWKMQGDQLIFTVAADRFLRNMVRALVGTLLEVGRGKRTVDQFRTLIEAQDRGKAASSAPPQGLFLTGVLYPADLYLNL